MLLMAAWVVLESRRCGLYFRLAHRKELGCAVCSVEKSLLVFVGVQCIRQSDRHDSILAAGLMIEVDCWVSVEVGDSA